MPDIPTHSRPRPGTAARNVTRNPARARILPLGALAAGFGLASAALAQATSPAAMPTPAAAENALPVVRAKASAEAAGKDSYLASETRIGKGLQDIRDIPQALTVITEKLIDDRKMDSLKDVLRNTAGISFQAAEGGEEDIKIHGISLQSTGDIFIDGMRDPAFYERDTFFVDRVELLRGSASLLFGRGSTGGAVNQVSKQAVLGDDHQIDLSLGSHGALRAVGDFNHRLGEASALRLGLMGNLADSNGAGAKIDKRGVAGTVRWGIGAQDEFSATLYALRNDNGIHYGVRWIRPTAAAAAANALVPMDPDTYHGLASDFNQGSASHAMLTHTHRFSSAVQLVTRLRRADYTRDQRATLWNFAPAAAQPGGLPVSLDTFGPDTALTRGQQLKKQDMQTLTAQSDLDARFRAWGLGHHLQAGVDFAHERKQVFAQVSATQGGSVPARPGTLIGTPSDGASIDESLRSYRPNNDYTARAWGAYLQNMVQISSSWKLLAGLRHDSLQGDYRQFAVPANALTPVTTTPYRMHISEWSQRAAVLFQPSAQWSFHLMGATSFNTSGDAYSLSAANQAIPPEQSVNVELGARFDTADGLLSARASLFRNTKLHERNTDPLLTDVVTLSGKRHAAGLDLDLTGRITPAWEVFGNLTWMPVASIDISSATSGELQGQRPSLSPRLSGTLWTTWQVLPKLRLGAGVNARSSQTPIRNPAGVVAPGFATVDLMAEYTVVLQSLSFRLNVNNLRNKLYADQLYSAFYVPGAGRVLSLTGSYRF